MKKIYQLSMFLLITCLVTKESNGSERPYDSSKVVSLAPLLKEQAKILFGIGQKVDLKKFDINTQSTRIAIQGWNRYMAGVIKIVQQSDNQHIACFVSEEECTINGQKGVNVYKLSEYFIQIIQELAERLKKNKHNFSSKLAFYIPLLEKVLKDLKTQLNVIKIPKSGPQADAKNLITTLSSIYEDVLKKIKEDFGIKKSDITLDIDNAFKIMFAADLTERLDGERTGMLARLLKKVQAFVDLSGSKDLSEIFNNYKLELDKIIALVDAAETFKADLPNLDVKKRKEMFDTEIYKAITQKINNAYNLVNKVSTYAASKREAKQVMLYLVEKYRQLADAFKKQWTAELNKPQVGRPVRVPRPSIYESLRAEEAAALLKKSKTRFKGKPFISSGKEELLVRKKPQPKFGGGVIESSEELEAGKSAYGTMTKEEVQYLPQQYPPLQNPYKK